MRNFIVIVSLILSFNSFSQEYTINEINSITKSIDENQTLQVNEYDLYDLTKISTDGGGKLTVWSNKNTIVKVIEEVGLSFGKTTCTMYFNNNVPIKIIDIEENFIDKNGELNYNKLKQVYKVTIDILDWKNDNAKVKRVGQRVVTDNPCSMFEYDYLIELSKKAIDK